MQSGSLAVFSPTALTSDVRTTIEALGNRVAYLTALDFEHHIFLSEWARAFPNAKILGPDGLAEKRAKIDEEFAGARFDYVWTPKNKESFKVDPEFDAEFDYEYVNAHANKELAFFHKRDKALIEADLLFNLPATEQYSRTKEGATSGFLTRMFVGLMSASGDAKWQKRFLWYGASAKDRTSFNQSAKKINSWDFDMIVPCHGDVIESGGKGIFQKVYGWHLNAAKS